ncbi:MAG: elongation factor Ts [Lentisphaerae bacterium]|jgi:elongation factor Ts|nr:elongation factor Ts [Lentisphaerota bacterium]MBT4820795.1 elongation factor Ts [Lentisphaerota bacterium]MBT5610160.1 elongation factor Ts [Lentisphaerota bacterium]MBT7057107.1 elongation factor Ts [Lentisphaerota bacterium]MBT7846170.1 elongation factor Ts [Lentisphaerota bacterium]
MAQVTAQMVKALRDKTDAGMMACKRALVESDGDMDQAVDVLRKAGVTKAAKKAGRSAKEGRVLVTVGDGVAALVEFLCETDFVAKTDDFREFGTALIERVATDYDGDGDISDTVAEQEKEALVQLIGKIGENMQIRRSARWQSDGSFGTYLHMGGKIGVLVDVSGEASDELLKDICMHIAAFNPQYVSQDEIPADVIAKEKEIAAAQVEGKPANIIDKIVIGKVNKWYSDVCLVKQPWIRDDKSCLAKAAPNVTVKRFLRWQIGEEL